MRGLSLCNTLIALGLYASVVPPAGGNAEPPCDRDKVRVSIVTDRGTIQAMLDQAAAPATVANFLEYARGDFFAGTLFHRVIPGFMIQGGGLTRDMQRKSTHAPVRNESTNGLSNRRGTLAMARTNDPDSATSQFFINLADNDHLNGKPGRPGYTVFGEVTGGMDVVDAIAAVETTTRAGHRDVPVEAITITRIEVTEAACGEAGDEGDAAP